MSIAMGLKTILKAFTKEGLTDEDRKNIDADKVPASFSNIANHVLSGYFEVKTIDSNIRVRPTVIEFYYHEEGEGQVKDPIVYHRNTKNSEKSCFRFGVLHNHVSGIDITFEHTIDGIIRRASVLIREFKTTDSNGNLVHLGDLNAEEKRPTCLYEALFSQNSIFDGISVQWKDGDHLIQYDKCEPRKNVYKYKEEKDKNGNLDFKRKEKIMENLCTRPWKFSLK